ncbi:MAG: hypothetical protein H7Y20_07125 [Bryobacteraceae bacterium]|nr:hypothetical protein [Bryobacteraceae bacterium]
MEEQQTESPDSAELTLIYIAKKLKEAVALEELLTAAAIEYHVEPDTYRGGIIFATERIGAFFYVDPSDVGQAHDLLKKNSYKPYELGG